MSLSSVEEKIETVKSRFIIGNLFALLWISIGTFACWIVNPLYGWLFLGFSTISIYLVIRRMLCNSCYYCKSCTKGFAKLSILFLGAKKIPGLSEKTILGMTVFIFFVLSIVPTLGIISSMLTEYSLSKFLASIFLAIVSLCALSVRVINRNKALWKPNNSK